MDCKPTNETLLISLKEKIATGDQNSFRQLFHLYAKKLTQFAYAIVKSNDAAREIVDEVFIKIWKNRATITSIQNLTVYLYTAIKNTALNYLSARAKESIIESFDFFSVQLSDDHSPEKNWSLLNCWRKSTMLLINCLHAAKWFLNWCGKMDWVIRK